MRIARLIGAGALVVLVCGTGSVAWAHVEFDPSVVPAGEVAHLTLTLENEQSDAGTVKIELVFPKPLTVADVPDSDTWTVTVQGGNIGADATGITWDRSSASPTENPTVKLDLGPIPSGAPQLQFKVLQTYSNGEIDRWIQDWPAGQPEPESPGPVLKVTDLPPTPPTSTTLPSSTAPSATTTTTSSTTTTVATNDKNDDSNAGLIVAIIAAALVIGGTAVWAVRRRRPTGHDRDPS